MNILWTILMMMPDLVLIFPQYWNWYEYLLHLFWLYFFLLIFSEIDYYLIWLKLLCKLVLVLVYLANVLLKLIYFLIDKFLHLYFLLNLISTSFSWVYYHLYSLPDFLYWLFYQEYQQHQNHDVWDISLDIKNQLACDNVHREFEHIEIYFYHYS